MKTEREHIELKFYDVLKHKISIKEFEQWVYSSKELEAELPEDMYTDLISLNFNDKHVHNELEKVIGHFVDFRKFEVRRIEEILESIVDRDENCAESIEMTYDLYCSGYAFLRRLGLTHGLLVSCPPAGSYQKTWKEITKIEQNELLNKLYPEVTIDAQNALDWMKEGKIVIKDSVNEIGDYEYDDFRSEAEIAQGEIDVIDLDAKEKPKGWKFWK